MPRGVPTTVICGQPMRFYNLDRPRADTHPVCCRPPHEGKRHMSAAAVELARQRARGRRHRRAAREQTLAA